MRIALYQCPPLPLDPEANLERLHQRAAEAAQHGARLLITPEMFLSGYDIGLEAVQRLAQPADGDWAARIAGIAREHGIAVLYGYPERDDTGALYNAVQLIDARGERLGHYRKTHLFGELDRGMFSAGEDLSPLVELEGWKLGLLVCYDVEFPENVRRLALAGADAVLVPTANMVPFDFVCEVLVRARAIETQCYLLAAGQGGVHPGPRETHGHSSIVDPWGRVLAEAGKGEAVLLARRDAEEQRAIRQRMPVTAHRRFKTPAEPAPVITE